MLLIILALAFLPQLSGQNFSLNGDALTVGPNCIAVTPNQAWQNGSVWYTDLLDLSQPFTLEFQMNYGTVDANGADGMMFVLQTIGPSALGEDGNGLGFEGFIPSFGIEFDTYYNSNIGDIPSDHIAFQQNGNVNHYQTNNLAGPVVANPIDPNIEDGAEHPIKIAWNPVSRVVQLYFDCVLRLSAQVDLVNTIFNGTTQVWWGFTGATGGLSNAQLVCLAETYEFNDNLEYTICQGESVQISANGNPDGNYSWLPSVGLSNSLLQSPVASPTSDTEYCYTYSDVCGNTTSGCIQVNVIIPPEVSAGSDDDFCVGDQFVLQGNCNQSDANVEWTDEAGGVVSAGSQLNPSVSEPGTYTITATSLIGQCSSTDEVVLNEFPIPTLAVDPVTNKCVYDSVIFDVGSGWQSVTWFDGSVSPTFIAHDPGFYNVTIEENNCEFDFTFEVSDIITPDVDLGEDLVFCEGETVDIDASMVVLWNTGFNNDILTVSQSGNYSAEIEWQGCFDRDTILVEELPLPEVDATDNDSFCESGMYVLVGASDQTDILFQWTLPSGVQTALSAIADLTVDLPGLYTLSAINTLTTCVGSDVVELTEVPLPVPDFDLLYQKCTYDSVVIDVGDNWQSVVWFDGTTANTWVAQEEGLYDVVIELEDCVTNVQVEVVDIITPDVDLGEDLVFCEGETVDIDASMVVIWNTGFTNDILTVSQSGNYSAEIEWQGCFDRDTILVEELPLPEVDATDNDSFCEGGMYVLDGASDQTDILFQWTLPSGAQTALSAISDLTVDLPGLYTLSAINTLTTCVGSDVVELTEVPLPVPDFDLLYQKCTYDSVVIDVGDNWQSVVWFDGTASNTWTADEEGLYSVSIELNDCETQVDIEVVNIIPPNLSLGEDQFFCEGEAVFINASMAVLWNTGLNDAILEVTQTGFYWAALEWLGCYSRDTIYVEEIPNPSVNATNNGSFCEGSELTITGFCNQSDVLFQWTLPSGTQTSINAIADLTADLPGLYTLTAINTLTTCAGSDVVELTEIPLPVPDFEMQYLKCFYDTVILDVGDTWQTVTWFDGSTGNTYVADSQSEYPVTIEQSGCTITVDIEVEDIVPPTIDLGLDRQICFGDSVQLIAAFPVEWQGGIVASNYMAFEEGTYVARISLDGCFEADTILVDTVEPLNLSLPPDTLLCEGNNLILQANYSGVWNTGDVDNAILVDQPGTYAIRVTHGPCVVEDSVVVNALLLPAVSINEFESYCDGELYELIASADNTDYYNWSTGDSTTSIIVSESTSVWVEVRNACGTSMSSAEVLFEDCSALIYMPTSFTPNGDGINDEFWPVVSNVKSYEITVYDRWGRTVFHSASIDNPWLGNSSEGDYFVPNGQYNYRLICTTEAGNAIERSGYITIVR